MNIPIETKPRGRKAASSEGGWATAAGDKATDQVAAVAKACASLLAPR